MKYESKIGPMYLLKVVSIHIPKSGHHIPTIYRVNFGDCFLAATSLHSFTLHSRAVKSTDQLVPGDLIWVDIGAFTTDGSFITKGSPPCYSYEKEN